MSIPFASSTLYTSFGPPVAMACALRSSVARGTSGSISPSSSLSIGAAALRDDALGASCPVRPGATTFHSLSRCDDANFSSNWEIVRRAARPGLRSSRGRPMRSGRILASLRDGEELVRSGVVRPVASKDVGKLLSSEGYILLDVRPIWERERAYVTGSYHVPLFVEDLSTGPLTLLKKGIQAGQGGWWLGLRLTSKNEKFAEQVESVLPARQKLVVACGESLRSLLALPELYESGFEQMAWMTGGFNQAKDEDFFQVEGSTELRFATVGGAAEYVLKFAILIQGLINLVKGRQKSIDSS